MEAESDGSIESSTYICSSLVIGLADELGGQRLSPSTIWMRLLGRGMPGVAAGPSEDCFFWKRTTALHEFRDMGMPPSQ